MTHYPPPPGHHTITPSVVVSDAAKVLGFIERAFGGKVKERYEGPGGTVAHAEVRIGDSVLMVSSPTEDMPAMAASLSLYVDDDKAVDATYRRAIDAGATSVREPANQFYGYRAATVRDPGGDQWTVCCVIEKVSPAETRKRMADMNKQKPH